jgi:thiol:disulfide interchange protein DsbD
MLCGAPSYATNETPQLPAEQAFILQSRVEKGQTLEFYWQIAPGYYLYKNQIKILNENNVSVINTNSLPKAIKIHDKVSGDYEVYGDSLLITISLPKDYTEDTFLVHYQGCSKSGFCFEPVNKQIYIDTEDKVHIEDVDQQDATQLFDSPEDADKLAATIKNRFLPITLAIFFTLGILLAFSPCVLPMIPLVINLIVGPKNITSHKAFVLTACYVLGMAGSYAIAGMFVGILGSTLQAWLQQPLILIILSAVLIILALVQFEIINVSLPHFNKKLHHWGQQQLQGSLLGAFVLGVISSLIISPCVTPPLIGALTYISQDGNPIVGALTLFSLGLGMGVPLMVVALLSSVILPKAGPWMGLIKSMTGVALLGLAILLLIRFVPEDLAVILWGALCIVAATFFKAFERLKNPTRPMIIIKSAGILLATLGAIIIINALGKEYQPITSSQWHNTKLARQLVTNLEFAKRRQQPAIVVFYAEWCNTCKKIEAEVLTDQALRDKLHPFMLIKVDITSLTPQDHELMNRYKVLSPPAILFFDKNGNEVTSKRVVGDVSADQLIDIIDH